VIVNHRRDRSRNAPVAKAMTEAPRPVISEATKSGTGPQKREMAVARTPRPRGKTNHHVQKL
jgi:hypothetical protein